MAPSDFRNLAVASETAPRTAYLVMDTESVPDGALLSAVKYPGEGLSPDEAVERARAEQVEQSFNGSDFIPVSFHKPVAVCVARVGADFGLQAITCLDAPLFRPKEIVKKFWSGLPKFNAKLITFNGRGFDLPLLEMAAFQHACSAQSYYNSSRARFGTGALDLLDWMNNSGACRHAGGLNLLAKMLGLPGKMGVKGDQVLQMHREGRLREINDYCLCDTLDTYFVFLRTRIMTGDIVPDREAQLVDDARRYLESKVGETPIIREYLANWTR